jgi:hypothetical protein
MCSYPEEVTNMKKILSVMLAFLIIFGMASCSSDKTEEQTDADEVVGGANENVSVTETGSFEYQLNEEGKCEIVKYTPNSVKIVDITLPEVLDGRDVVGIADSAFKAENSIKSVKVPASYTYVGNYAFYDCDSLQSIEFVGEELASIGDNAFEGCDVLATVKLPKSVVSVGKFAFKDCKAITSIELYGSVESVGEGAFFGDSALKTVKIADSVKYMDKNAFYGCDALEYTEENNAIYLGNDANKYLVLVSATNLDIESCTVNAATKVIADNAFINCDMLTSLTLGAAITEISSKCFEGCTELVYNESENGYYLGTAENPYMVLMSLVVPSVEDFTLNTATKIICDAAFVNCTALSDIHFAGTTAEWEAITRVADWNNGRTIRIVFADETQEPIIYE